MAETLGSLCDKLTILKLKEWHSQDQEQLKSISFQEKLLQNEINQYILCAVEDSIVLEHLAFSSNKIYHKEDNSINEFHGNIGEIFSQLALINCKLWHQQEKVYEFHKVPPKKKDNVVKSLAVLNLERNQCIDEINSKFGLLIKNSSHFQEKGD
jgi:hypothetical protein